MCVHIIFDTIVYFISIFIHISYPRHTFTFLMPAFRQYLYYYAQFLSHSLTHSHTQIQCDKITFKISCYCQNALNETICSLKRNIMHSISPSSTQTHTFRALAVLCLLTYLLAPSLALFIHFQLNIYIIYSISSLFKPLFVHSLMLTNTFAQSEFILLSPFSTIFPLSFAVLYV